MSKSKNFSIHLCSNEKTDVFDKQYFGMINYDFIVDEQDTTLTTLLKIKRFLNESLDDVILRHTKQNVNCTSLYLSSSPGIFSSEGN